MNNFTESDKETLQGIVEGGAEVSFVAYNPLTVVGSPEADAIADGWVQHYKETSTNLIEVIYTR